MTATKSPGAGAVLSAGDMRVARGQQPLRRWSAEVAVDGLAGDVECLGDARDGVDPLAVGVLSFNAKMKFRTVTAQTRIGAVA